MTVRPHARAGVEIDVQKEIMQNRLFALMRGRELKFRIPLCHFPQFVRPHARAGVEIVSAQNHQDQPMFALMRGRELK